VCPFSVPTAPISAPFCSHIGGRPAIGANPFGISTVLSTLMPLVISSVSERATNGGFGLGASTVVEHAHRPAPTRARIRVRKDVDIQKR
jgi:hypothetical protein